jgi:hypothetical protein
MLESIKYKVTYKPYNNIIEITSDSRLSLVLRAGVNIYYQDFVELCEADKDQRSNLCLLHCHIDTRLGDIIKAYLNDPQSVKWFIRRKSNKSRRRM